MLQDQQRKLDKLNDQESLKRRKTAELAAMEDKLAITKGALKDITDIMEEIKAEKCATFRQ